MHYAVSAHVTRDGLPSEFAKQKALLFELLKGPSVTTDTRMGAHL